MVPLPMTTIFFMIITPFLSKCISPPDKARLYSKNCCYFTSAFSDYLFWKCFSARFSRKAPASSQSPHGSAPAWRRERPPAPLLVLSPPDPLTLGSGGGPRAWARNAPMSMGALLYLFWKCFSARFSRKAPMPSSLSAVPQQTPKASASKAEPVAISVCMPMRMQRLDS